MWRIFWNMGLRCKSPHTSEAGESGSHYSMGIGLIYIYNLIVATGALTLPASFAKAGWMLSTIILIFLAFMSYVTATYIVETMACVNAVLKYRRLRSNKRHRIRSYRDSEEDLPCIHRQHSNDNPDEYVVCSNSVPSQYFSLERKVELGEMAEMFLNRTGVIIFYIVLFVFLYGDLAIYATTVAKSVMDIVCTSVPVNITARAQWQALPCFNGTSPLPGVYSRRDFFRFVLLTFFCMVGPLVFFSVQKTKYLQILTSGMRWSAFLIMIIKATYMIFRNGVQGKPPAIDFKGLPIIFGACVYSYMCHPFLPIVISPIRDKTNLGLYLGLTYAVISLFYLLLASTGAFAFARLSDIYTLNFIPKPGDKILQYTMGYFLAMFPVFTLCTAFPIVAITLRDNLIIQFYTVTRNIEAYRFVIFSIVSLIPPLVLPYCLEDVTMLVKITGAFAGTGVQYLIPTILVMSARRYCHNIFGISVINRYQSPFSHIAWEIFVLLWSVVCIVVVCVNMY